ncbi:hypothetical protein [Halofilum ochraceum]|uniref:hypothetical protein n=1 Tax=Halofilum ochraceum TaxID=1611323 RepID=UPI0009F69A9E|nr:hypothetical protein [Halofilum ochraceum]
MDTRTYAGYEYRYALTDALIWWADSGKLGLDTDLVGELRAYRQMGDLVADEAPAAKLKAAREQVESAELTGTISLLISLVTGDEPLATIPPRSDHLSGLLENLRNLNVQYEVSAPIASRLIPGMNQKVVETTYQPDGDALGLGTSKQDGMDD